MGRVCTLVAALLLTLAPAWKATLPTAHAAGGFGIATSDFTKVTPADAQWFTSIQATTADQASNFSSLESRVLSRVRAITPPGSDAATQLAGLTKNVAQLEAALSAIFNGEAALAVLPVTTSVNSKGKTVAQFHVLIDAGLKPGLGAAAVMGSLMLGGLQGTTATTYKGVTITKLNLQSLFSAAVPGAGILPAPSRSTAVPLWIAVVNNIVVVSGDPLSVHAAIDAAQGAVQSLATNADFQSTFAQLPAARLSTIFVHRDLQAEHQLALALGSARAAHTIPMSGTYSQAFAVSAQPTGILVTASPTVTTGALTQTVTLSPLADVTAGALPAGTLLYAAINDPGSMIQTILTQIAALAGTANTRGLALDPLQVVNRLLGMDLNQDVFSWMHGEASMAILPAGAADAKTAAARRLSMVVTLKVDDPALVQQKLQQIVGALQSLSDNPSRLQFVPTTGPGGVVEQVLAATPNGMGYAFVNGYLVVASALPADVASLQGVGPGTSLATDPQFRDAVQEAGSTPAGAVVYANLTALRLAFEQIAQDEGTNLTKYNANVRPWLTTFTSLSMVARAGSGGGGAFFLETD